MQIAVVLEREAPPALVYRAGQSLEWVYLIFFLEQAVTAIPLLRKEGLREEPRFRCRD